LSEFQKVRQQKNRLLKGPLELISRDHLSAWNVQFAATGAKVMASRLTYLSMIEDLAAIAYLELSDGREHLGMTYQSSVLEGFQAGKQVPDALELEAAMSQQLEVKMSDEIRRGTSLIGPHRDDIRFFLNELEAEAYGSQGQQRSIVLALKLTELKCLTAKLQEPPVLLLDDVMAELDPDRQRLLVEHIHPESQVFITTTHPSSSWQSLLERQPEAGTQDGMAVFQVHQGELTTNAEWSARV
jgi:DNA replication and repair protein RecF